MSMIISINNCVLVFVKQVNYVYNVFADKKKLKNVRY